ncbi:hypothetical protein [Natrinema sp. H-ect4]|uniref:hypothetical protein n=1 Tax=Natrinema sp. H-ect4 TaxID=3242699 RepID=UPI0035A93B29
MRREDYSPDCQNCGKNLYINAVERPHVDWVKCVCSKCGEINDISMVRLAQKKEKAKGVDLPGSESDGDTN